MSLPEPEREPPVKVQAAAPRRVSAASREPIALPAPLRSAPGSAPPPGAMPTPNAGEPPVAQPPVVEPPVSEPPVTESQPPPDPVQVEQ